MTSRSLLATQLINFLEAQEITYVIMGDSTQFPHHIPSDIDIVLDPKVIAYLPKIVFKFCSVYKARVVQFFQHEQNAYYYVLAVVEQDLTINFFHPDICADYFRGGKRLLRAEEILEGRVSVIANTTKNACNFFVSEPSVAFTYYLLKKIFKGMLNQSHGHYLSSEWRKNPSGVFHQLKRFLPDHEVRIVLEAAKTDDWSIVRSRLPTLQKTLQISLGVSLNHWFWELRRRFKRIVQPTGLFVVFLGTDGSGKSTIIKQVERKFSPAFRQTKCYHLRPFFGCRPGKAIRVTEPHGKDLRDRLSSIVKLGLWWLDYTIGYFLDVFPRLRKSTLVLFDRYYYDLLVDYKRYRYGGPSWLATLVGRFIPSPDLIILLDAPAEIVCMRKQEVLPLEVCRQRLAYKALISKFSNSYSINASLPLETVLLEVDSIIIDFLEKRAVKRLGILADAK